MTAPATLLPHRISLSFENPPLPKQWNGGRAVETQLMNALSLLFPFGERYFVRVAKGFVDGVKDPVLLAQVKGFIAQEVHHAHQHEESFSALDAQGIPATAYAARLAGLFAKHIEPRLSARLGLSAIAAVEHFTATVGEYVFTSELVVDAEPRMRELFRWHAAEEIEHKCVAYDLLQSVDRGYLLRAAGMLIAVTVLLTFWYGATVALLLHDKPVGPFRALREWVWAARHHRIPVGTMLLGTLDYLRPSFHPGERDNFHHARDYFAARSPAA